MEIILKLKRGWLEIPKKFQEKLHLKEDDEIILTAEKDHLIMKIKPEKQAPAKVKPLNHSLSLENSDARWAGQMEFWQNNKQQFILDPRYHGKYVAISEFQIIGTAEEKFELYHQIREQTPKKFFIIVKALADHELPKYRIESPQVRQ